MKNAIIIPTLEPDDSIMVLVSQLKKFGFSRIAIIDDGSSDRCNYLFDLLDKEGCFIFHHEINLGKGEAIKTGIREIHNLFPDIGYITADGDGQHHPLDIHSVAVAMEHYPDSIILGSRMFDKKLVPFKSYYGNKISSIFFKLETGITCRDTQTGLRGIPNALTQFALMIPGSRYDYEMNFLIAAAKKKIDIHAVSIKTIYENKNKGSHFRPIQDAILIYKKPIRFLISSVSSACFDFLFFFLFITYFTKNNILFATICSRLLSGMYNYTLNKNWSFKDQAKNKWSGCEYFILFLCQMMMSSFFVTILQGINLAPLLLKLLVDSCLTLISYIIQRNYIFNRRIL